MLRNFPEGLKLLKSYSELNTVRDIYITSEPQTSLQLMDVSFKPAEIIVYVAA